MSAALTTLFGAVGAVASLLAVLLPVILTQGARRRRELDELRGEIERLRHDALLRELRGETDTLRSEMRGEIDTLRGDVRGETDTLRGEVRSEIDAVLREVRGAPAATDPTTEATE